VRALILVVLAACSAASAQPGSGSAVADAGVDAEIDAAFIGPLLPGAYPVDAGIDAPPDAAIAIDAGVVVVADARVDRESPSLDLHTASTAGADEEPADAVSSSLYAIKIIGGLVALLALAYLGGHRKVVRFQERLGISGVITAGFPFIAMGLIASLPSIGILSGEVLGGLKPLLHFGLGWLGFIIGAQLDIRVLDRVPRGTAYLILVEALGPFGITATACGAVMIAFGVPWDDPTLWRDAILLGAAAAMTAPRKFRGFANRGWSEGRGADALLGQLDELVGVIGLLFVTAYFRGDAGTWDLPSTAWVFVSLGIGVAIGALIFAMVRVPVNDAEFLAVVLGAIAFASGIAGYLQLSPIVVCFIAGVLVTNFPNEERESIFRILNHLERSVHMLFLIIAGAVWVVTDWRGWVLVPVFVAARVLGKLTGVFASKTVVGSLLPAGFASERKLVTPLSSLSIALVLSVESSGDRVAWIVTAVIGAALLTELLLQRTDRDVADDDTREPEEPGEFDGPEFRDDTESPP
jgi:Kef-type K+ transport system membrane component KefB